MRRDTRKVIIEGAIKNIQRLGIQNVSVRSIAKECGLTFSNLRYYFKTKEELLNEVTRRVWEINISEITELWNQREDTRSGLESLAHYIIVGGIQNKNIVLSAFLPIHDEGENTYFFDMFNELFITIAKESKIPQNKIYMFFSSIFFSTLYPTLFKSQEIQFTNTEFIKEYINQLLEVIL